MNQYEPIAANRVVPGRLLDAANNPLPLNTVFAAGDLKIVQPDNTIANAAHLPTAIAGALPGSFNIQLDIAEISQIGNVRLQLYRPGVFAPWEWNEQISPSIAAQVLTATLDAAAPANIQTLQQVLNLIASWIAGNATGFPTSLAQAITYSSLDGTKTRLEGQIANGLRTITKRDGT